MAAPILHVIPHLWSGAGAVLTRLCEAQRRGGPVVIVTGGTGVPNGDWPSYRARLRAAGVAHHTINFLTRDPDAFWSNARKLTALVHQLQPRVIHAHSGVPACAAALAREWSGSTARLIGQMYSWGEGRPEWMNVEDCWGFAQCNRVVCSADAYWDLLVRYGVPKRKLVYIPWGLPLDELPYRGDRPVNTDAPVIGFVGRIEARKGQLELVEAFRALLRKRPHARLELAGPIADRGYARIIREYVTTHRLSRSVSLLGRVDDMAARVSEWDLFVSMSKDEGQGMAVLEAMAVGVPVATRSVAGLSDFVRDGRNAFILNGCSRAIPMDALEDDAMRRRVSRAARRIVERSYSDSQSATVFETVYAR